jgi:competence ComEA-like helix-hairpin-helix protein
VLTRKEELMSPEVQVKERDPGEKPEGPPLVDLNQATVEELRTLPGIGAVLARRIVAYREEQGGLHSLEELAAVPGISHSTYERLADQLAVTPSETSPRLAAEQAVGEGTAAVSPEIIAPQEAAPPEVEEVIMEEAILEALLEEEPIPPAEEAVEAAPVKLEVPVPEKVVPPEVKAAVPEKKRGAVAKETPAAEKAPSAPPVEAAAPPSPAVPTRKPAQRWGLSWLWSSLIGGLLGMIFTLLVFSGINGSLDLSNSHAILDVQNRMENLAAEMKSLSGEVDGLRQRLDTLEGLTARMEKAESAVDTLREETTVLEQQADTLAGELVSVSEDLSGIQAQTQQVTTFFDRLQALLNEVFGAEEMTEPTPEAPIETPVPTE